MNSSVVSDVSSSRLGVSPLQAKAAAAAGVNRRRNAMRSHGLMLGLTAATLVGASALAATAQAQDSIYIPLLTYRSGPFAGSGSASW